MFKIKTTKGIVDKVRGVLMTPIQYEVRVSDGDWSPYFGNYQNQKWGEWDSNSCWCLSAINCAEDQLEWLHKNGKLSEEAVKFFTDNGYIDSDGDFSCSERFLEILSGVHDNGNSQMQAWVLMQKYGLIPRDKLTYSKEQAQRWFTKFLFNQDYFNPKAITPEMIELGRQSLNYINISRQWIGTMWKTPDMNILRAALKQAPLQIGIPIPANVQLWNSEYVQYDNKKTADHAIQLYKINDNDSLAIFDQYLPNLKTLSKGYYIPLVTQGIIMATPVVVAPPTSFWDRFYTALFNWYNGITSNNADLGSAKI